MARTNSTRARITLEIPRALQQRVKKAAARRELSISAYVKRLLERAVAGARPGKGASTGVITAAALRRFATLRARQPEPFSDDSVEIIRESRQDRQDHL